MFHPASFALAPVIGVAMLCCGNVLQILSLASLGRSSGIVAANRGIRINGMYRFVRHPLYFSYCLSGIGFALASFSLFNIIVCALLVGLIILSIREEEHLLLPDADYCEYCQATPWRLIPGVY